MQELIKNIAWKCFINGVVLDIGHEVIAIWGRDENDKIHTVDICITSGTKNQTITHLEHMQDKLNEYLKEGEE
ncbi:hypothetical protein ACW2QC_09160 [Virgibacillus sp. FSP13]